MGINFHKRLETELSQIRSAGLYKQEHSIRSEQGAGILVNDNEVLNFCSNNYLGLSSHSQIKKAAKECIDNRGYGLSSVRFICGTQDIHKELEKKLSAFLQMEDTILYPSAFDANGGLFEPLFNEKDAIISDALNHASLIDGIRLCKAKRFRYEHNNMADLEQKLLESATARHRVIVTDSVFSMDGTIAQLDRICDLARRYHALVVADESHATGFMGPTGRGAVEHCGVLGKVDIITGTFGKALGGASGGFTSAAKPVIEILRQRSRPYLFSNTLAPVIAGTTITVLNMLSQSNELRERLHSNTELFRTKMTAAGFELKPGTHPIVPVMLYDAVLAQKFAAELLSEGIYVKGFFYPVVPKNEARIRVQLSAAHYRSDIDRAVAAFIKVGRKFRVIPERRHAFGWMNRLG